MRFDLKNHESLVLFFSALGLVEQELMRLLFGLEPSDVLSPIFGTLVLATLGSGAVRGFRHGNDL